MTLKCNYDLNHILEDKRFGFLLLSIAIILETVGSNCLKMSSGFQAILPSILFLTCYSASFSLLIVILKSMPLGLAYGIWGGAGTVLTALSGIIFWNEQPTPLVGCGILAIIGGIFLMAKGDSEFDHKD